MLNFPTRSGEAEILDDLQLDRDSLAKNLRELEQVNRLLGGHQIIRDSLKTLPLEEGASIADYGCGGGDTLLAIAGSSPAREKNMKLIGYDLNPCALEIARENAASFGNIRFAEHNLLSKADFPQHTVALFNLVLHHFTDEEVLDLLRKATKTHRYVIINDLQRNRIPYQLFKLVSLTFNFSPVSRHDGLLSVKKSFTKKDWNLMAQKLQLTDYHIQWRWAFRWVVTIKNEAVAE